MIAPEMILMLIFIFHTDRVCILYKPRLTGMQWEQNICRNQQLFKNDGDLTFKSSLLVTGKYALICSDRLCSSLAAAVLLTRSEAISGSRHAE